MYYSIVYKYITQGYNNFVFYEIIVIILEIYTPLLHSMKKLLLWLVFLFILIFFDSAFAIDDITSSNFTIDVGTITPTPTSLISDEAGWTVTNFLASILNKLILVFWVFSAFIMTIGAWYMIIYHGQDEFLSKWKSIFMAGLISLAIALSAGIIVRLFAYLLYS